MMQTCLPPNTTKQNLKKRKPKSSAGQISALIEQADEAQKAADRNKCVQIIVEIYDFLDESVRLKI